MPHLGRFLWHVAPALVIVFGGGFLVNRFFVRKANLAILVDRISAQLETLAGECAEYWCSEQEHLGKEKAPILEAKIKGRILHLRTLLRVAEQKYRPRARSGSSFDDEILGLQQACTGGDFEVATRTADRKQFLRAVNAIHQLNASVLQGKL